MMMITFSLFSNSLFSMSFWVNSSFLSFIFLVAVVSLLMLVYIKYYMLGEMNIHVYTMWMLCFMTSMLFLLCSCSVISLLLSWETLGLSSFFLIFYYNTWESQMNSLVTVMTMRVGEFLMFFVMSTVIVFNIMNFSFFNYVGVLYFFVFLFLITKSAQFPFSGWLPKAMSAPTPTSALVHSSTLVTAGFVVLMNFSEMMMSPFVLSLMIIVGSLTMIMGSGLSFMESSVKKVVAFSTLSQMGLALVVFGLGNFHVGFMNLISHGFAKSLLFIQIGYLIHVMNLQQNVRSWGSAWGVEGFMKVQILTTLFSLCGMMFLGGMLTKESLMELMISNSMLVFFMVLLLLCIYSTFVYSILLYKCLFNNSGSPTMHMGGSIIMMVITSIEVIVVMGFISWMMMNSISLMNGFIGFESFIPVLVMLVFFLSSPNIINHQIIYLNLNNLLNVLSSNSVVKWLSFLLPLKFVEMFLNHVNLMIFMLVSKISNKVVYSLSFSQLVSLMLIIMILLV